MGNTSKDDIRKLYENSYDILKYGFNVEPNEILDINTSLSSRFDYGLDAYEDSTKHHAEATFETCIQIGERLEEPSNVDLSTALSSLEEFKQNANIQQFYSREHLLQQAKVLDTFADRKDLEVNYELSNPFTSSVKSYEQDLIEYTDEIVNKLTDQKAPETAD